MEGAPDEVPAAGGANFMALIPMLGAATSMTVMMIFRGSSLAALGALMMVVTVIASVVLLFTQKGKAKRQRQLQRETYLEYLDTKRTELLGRETSQRRKAWEGDPSPAALMDVIRDPHRLWERRRGHEDFLRVRVGTGERPGPRLVMQKDEKATTRPDRFLAAEAARLKARFESVPDMPVVVDLDSRGDVSVVGDPASCLALVRDMVLEAAALHSPEDLQIAVAVPDEQRAEWEWAAALPHALDQDTPTKVGPVRRVVRSVSELDALLAPELRRRVQAGAEARRGLGSARNASAGSRLLIVDATSTGPVQELSVPDRLSTLADLGVTALRLITDAKQEPGSVSLRLRLGGTGLEIEDYAQDELDPVRSTATPDVAGEATGAALSRALSPLRLSPDSLEHDEVVDAQRFTDLIGVKDFAASDLERTWGQRSHADFLRVPIGTDDKGTPVLLDLKEAAQFGMGPHGLCVGATGSGKSELLRTLVLALLVTHRPEDLNMVLVDFKGGATFAPFEGAPHLAGIITNLSDDVSLVDRVYASLAGEIQRRQEVLKRAGNIANITDYQLLRRERGDEASGMEPLPHLLVIIDEFGELLTAQPDFIDLFLSIGRIGRSIGVHLMLSSQRIEGGKLRGLDTYLSYRIGLRTLSESESRTVLETPDAFHLPPAPGYGYLKVDTTTYSRFRAGYVSGPLPAAQEQVVTRSQDAEVLRAPRFADELPPEQRSEGSRKADEAEVGRTTGPTVMSTLVDVLRERPRATAEIWLPPLPDVLALDTVTGPLGTMADGASVGLGGDLQVPLGLLDDPSTQWQGPWMLDLKAAGGNVALIGAPQTGKSTALRTIALSLAATHDPHEVAIYGIDLLGSGLRALEVLPHVGGIGVRTAREAVRRTVEEVLDMIEARQVVFEERGIDSLEEMRSRCAAGAVPELPVADVVLLVDGYGQLSDEFEDIERLVHDIAARGSGFGVHVVATGTRWNDIRIAQQSYFGHRIEFRLSEPAESSFGKKIGESVPVDRPGRAVMGRKLLGQFALPVMDAQADTARLGERLAEAAEEIAEASEGYTAPQVRILPGRIEADRVAPASDGNIALGWSERDLSERKLSLFGRDRHLLVLGDMTSGKTNVLRHVARSVIHGATEDEVVVAFMDPRQELLGVVPEEFNGGHATSAALAGQLAHSIAGELAKRVPSDPLAARREGPPLPRIVLVVDDYDVLTAGNTSPLAPLAPYASMASELGFHVVAARRVAGASRGLYEPFTMAVREAGAAVFLMDGDRSEGPLINGVRAKHFPPGRGMFLRGGRPPETLQSVLDGATIQQESQQEESA
jgi:S-DNA-T family DNA segregation ATPase FtsK/SpoIIIE